MFSLTKSSIYLLNLLHNLKMYRVLSILTINFAKSEAIGLGIPQTQLLRLQANFNLKWTNTALKYLGTYIPSKFSNIFSLNFPPLLKSVRSLLSAWHTGLHSWFGRCNILKIGILPKFVCLLQALPIHIPVDYIWARKRPRLRQTLLSIPKHHSGLAMPDIRTYYYAAHLSRLINWF